MRALLIMGPTASGKSALALALAERLGGEIVNADSMQVYRDLRIITARPTSQEEECARHHLYGHVDALAPYSVGSWVQEARGAVAAIQARGGAAILVGGTGLYFRAFLEGLAEIPTPDSTIVAALREDIARRGTEALHAVLTRTDPSAAHAIHPNDERRIVRALSVFQSSGRRISEFWSETRPHDSAQGAIAVVVDRDATELRELARSRYDVMLRDANEEVRALIARNLPDSAPLRRAVGLAPAMSFAKGAIGREQAVDAGAVETAQMARKQRKWIRRYFPEWRHIDLTGVATLEGYRSLAARVIGLS